MVRSLGYRPGMALTRGRKITLVALAVLAALLALNAIAIDSQTRPAAAYGGGQVLDLPGGDLHVLDEGDPTGPPIVLLHGWTESLRVFDAVAGDLRRDHRVIRIDLLGHGGSEKPESGYSIDAQASLVALALGTLDVEGAAVVGHSMGGIVATALAERASELVDRLILIDTAPSRDHAEPSLLIKSVFVPVLGHALWRVGDSDWTRRRGARIGFADGFEVPDFYVADIGKLTRNAFVGSARGVEAYSDASPLHARITALGLPLLVIWGRDDKLTPVGAVEPYRQVPGAQIQVLDGAGHTPIVEQPGETAKLLLAFTSDLGAAPEEEPEPAERARPKRR